MPPRKQTGRTPGRPRKNRPPAEVGFMQWMNKASGAEAEKFLAEIPEAQPPKVAPNEFEYEDYVKSLKPPPHSQAYKDYMNSYLSGATDPSLLDEPMEEEPEVADFDINEYLNLPESPKEVTQGRPDPPPSEGTSELRCSGDSGIDQGTGPSQVQAVASAAPGESVTDNGPQAACIPTASLPDESAMEVDTPVRPATAAIDATALSLHPASSPQPTPKATPSSSSSRPRRTRAARGRAQSMRQSARASKAATQPPIEQHKTNPNPAYYREDSAPPILDDPSHAPGTYYRPPRVAYFPATCLNGHAMVGSSRSQSASSIYDQPLASTSHQATNAIQTEHNVACLPPPGTYRLSDNWIEVVSSIPSPPSSQASSSTPSPLSHASTPPSSTSNTPHIPPSHSLGPLAFARSDDTFMRAVANGTPHLVPVPTPQYVPCQWVHCTDRACPTPCVRHACPTPCVRHACPKWFDRALSRSELLVDIYTHFALFGYNQEQLDAIAVRVYAEVVGS
ncbi:uncharacterized protein SCHCODRAFT_02594735 [Schizophyllum commune H4-8]|uniref:uncharacterized protein n=1 Tax=Schizophyllum commune (strain H4-8 / FGSC 9210) TaxID=578458 RepID=UPI0021609D9C|nr:uncharacterized protein SCHCODRAFT_02594735 [Schizophyllum commune H4-8]KAI5884859.1 hypothetical protein SCHCODRAFT_02594735 [Schizophyllum commune H4-8]